MRLAPVALAAALALALPATAGAATDRWFAVPITMANDGSGSDGGTGWVGAAADGSGVYFVSDATLTADDADGGSFDAYRRLGARLELMSGPAPDSTSGGGANVSPRGLSADGSTIVFTSTDSLSPDDLDDEEVDLYEHSDGVTRLVSIPDPSLPQQFEFPQISPAVRISADGRFVAFTTTQKLSTADTDFGSSDVYVYDRESHTAQLATPGGSLFGSAAMVGAGGDADHLRVFSQTTQQLTGDDTDSASDIYAFDTATGTVTLWTPGTADTPIIADVSADGTHLFFRSDEQLRPEDVDSARDVYQYAGGETTLITTATGFSGASPADFQKASADGSIVYFTTPDQMSSDDGDGGIDDIYSRSEGDGAVSLVSQGPGETLTSFNSIFADITPDGRHAFFDTPQDLSEDDDDSGSTDAYERADGVTTRISVGEINDQALEDGSFAGYSADTSRFIFASTGQMTTDDADSSVDLYSRHDGHTALVTPPADEPCTLLPSTRCEPVYHGFSRDGRRVWFDSDEKLHPLDTDANATDVYESRLALPGSVTVDAASLAMEPGDPLTPVDPALEVSDPYDDVFGATVKIASGFASGSDELVVGGTSAAIAVSLNSAGDTLTLTGRATDAEYRDLLRTVAFRATSRGRRDIEFTVDNGAGPAAAAVRRVEVGKPVEGEPSSTPPPGDGPPAPGPGPAQGGGGGPGPLAISIQDSGEWVSHVRRPGVFRVPGLVFYCPKTAAASCEATVGTPLAEGSVTVPPGETRGIKLALSASAKRTLRRHHGRLRMTAAVEYTLAGAETATASKRFLLLWRGNRGR